MPAAQHVLCAWASVRRLTLVGYVCILLHPGQVACSDCGASMRQRSDRGKRCLPCRYKHEQRQPQLPLAPALSTEAIVTRNVSTMMHQLPVHSHHRAPLIHHLSRDLPSTTAAELLHTTASYVRQCKRKDYSESDLLQDKYSRDVKRQKAHPGVLQELVEYLRVACPVKSGSRSETHRQYVTDDALYQGYITTVEAPMSFHTFMKIKQWMRVRHVGEIIQLTEEKEQCEQHQQLSFRSAINTS